MLASGMTSTSPIVGVGYSGASATLVVRGDLSRQAWLVQVMRELADMLDRPETVDVMVDMSGVTGLDKQSMAYWVWLERFVREQSHRLKIVNPSAAVLAAAGKA
jgi:ABC-type transporter Mla MlaB component